MSSVREQVPDIDIGGYWETQSRATVLSAQLLCLPVRIRGNTQGENITRSLVSIHTTGIGETVVRVDNIGNVKISGAELIVSYE